MTHLVSLNSEHLLPNFLFIKEMTGKYDDLLFIITQDTFIVNLRVAQIKESKVDIFIVA
ncbi:hypothetical protein FACS189426_20590 [Bacteroidia bacterium]|nr:hypothetical protein FACS189426_20590 [Bacteroidia bacterium]